jgi:hypothetical protein
MNLLKETFSVGIGGIERKQKPLQTLFLHIRSHNLKNKEN